MTGVLSSVRLKTMLVVMATTLTALLLSGTALLLNELRIYRAGWVNDLQTQADLVAQSSMAAIAFDDARVARENLALLRLRPQVEAAALYGADGKLFADYTAEGQARPAALAGDGDSHIFDGDRLVLQRPLLMGGERIGLVVVRARHDIGPRLSGYLLILGGIGLASLAAAGLVGTWLQRAVTEPIVAVATVARNVVEQRNYALRATKTTSDETGALVDAFNDMLAELGGQAQTLQAADRRKDEFLATLAHELRNPLAPLTTALAVVARSDIDAATRKRMQEMMQRQLAQLVRLIDDLLEVARISTGRLELRRETLDLRDVLRSALESAEPAIQQRGHALHYDEPAEPVPLHGDRTRLSQVFINLLNNASKYTDPGGHIAVTVRSEAGAVEVEVADDGIGIDPARQAEIFEMFVQVDPSLERGRTGLGVGLSLARQLVALHGGALTLHSDGLGRGSRFTVRLTGAVDPDRAATGVPAQAAV